MLEPGTMHKDDRDFIETLIAATMICFTVAIVVALWAGAGEGQQASPVVVNPQRIELHHYPLEGTGYECVLAVSEAPEPRIGTAFTVRQTHQWIGCYNRKDMGITPTPSPEPTPKKVG